MFASVISCLALARSSATIFAASARRASIAPWIGSALVSAPRSAAALSLAAPSPPSAVIRSAAFI